MALNTASGFTLGSSDPIDDRLVLTKAQMKSANDNVYPDVYMCVCTDDGCIYTYNKSNEVDAVTGKFRLFKSGDDSDFETKLKEYTQDNVDGNKDLPVSDTAIKNLMAAENGLATLDSTGKLVASQLPTSAREIVGYMDASVDHTLPDEADYDNGNEIIITATGYVIQSTAFTLEAGKTLTNLEVGQVTQLIALGYVFTLDGFGTVSSFATDKVSLLDGTEIALPYASDLSATSVPATVQVPVKEGDSIMLIDGHWIHLSSTSGVESVNGKTGVVTVQEYDADNKEQLAKIGENAEGNLTYNGEEIKGGSDEWTGTKAEWEALSTEEKAKFDGKKLNFTDSEGENLIDDTAPANNKVYSSEKVKELFDEYTEMTWTPASDVANGGNICGFVVHNVAHIYGWVTPTKKGTNQLFYTCTNFKAVKTLHITNWEGNISTVETTEFPCASYNGGVANGRIKGSYIMIHVQEDFVGKNLTFNFTALVEPIQ